MIFLVDLDTMSNIVANDLNVGDVLVNVGRVTDIGRIGVFVAVRVVGARPDLATGRILTEGTTLFFHEMDSLTVVQA